MLIIIRIYAAMETRNFQKASDFSMEKCSKKKKHITVKIRDNLKQFHKVL